MINKLDFLVVGSGLFGATFAQQCKEHGKTCMVIERMPHIAGLAHTKLERGIMVHSYGAHGFHTNNEAIWDYVNRFAKFNQCRLQIMSKTEKYGMQPFPPNRLTRMSVGVGSRIIPCPGGFETDARFGAGNAAYEAFYAGYTEKMWGKKPEDMPAELFRRRPPRDTWNCDCHEDTWQGTPIEGYTEMVANMLHGIPLELGVDYLNEKEKYDKLAHRVVYTGRLDALFRYCFDPIPYRVLDFTKEWHEVPNKQGVAVVNYPSLGVPHIRTIEHKFLARPMPDTDWTVVTTETPRTCVPNDPLPMYPFQHAAAAAQYYRYTALARRRKNLLWGGRIGGFKYFEMDQTIASALQTFQEAVK